MELTGSEVVVDANAPRVLSVSAPLTFELAEPTQEGVLAFEGATIDDGAFEGLLVVTGDSVQIDAGAIFDVGRTDLSFGSDMVALSLPPGMDDASRPSIGPDGDPAHQAAIDASVPADVRADELRVWAFASAYVVTETETIPLTDPFSVSAQRIYLPAQARVEAESVEADWTGMPMFIGLTPEQGEAFTDAGPLAELPSAVLARDGVVRVGPSMFRTLEPMRVRQALDTDGVLLESAIELRSCNPVQMYMSADEKRILRFAYHQSTGLTDAAFSDVWAEDAGGNQWNVRIELDGELPDELTSAAQAYPEYSWGQLLVDYVQFWVDVTEAFIDGFTCIFTLGFVCDDDSASEATPLLDYPAWIEPNEFGQFEAELQAPSDPGEYTVTLHIEGENYTAEVPLLIAVR